MSYEAEILERLSDSSRWPNYQRPDFLAELDQIADDALASLSARDCIASVLIYQQLIEELLRVLLQSLCFLIQASLFPIEITFSESSGKMFGRLVDDIKATVNFPNKNELITIANRVNERRMQVAHGLTKRESLNELESVAVSVRDDFEEFFKLFDKALDWSRVCLHDIKKILCTD